MCLFVAALEKRKPLFAAGAFAFAFAAVALPSPQSIDSIRRYNKKIVSVNLNSIVMACLCVSVRRVAGAMQNW